MVADYWPYFNNDGKGNGNGFIYHIYRLVSQSGLQ